MLNSEQNVIGSILAEPDQYHLVSERLTVEMFQDILCAAAYAAMVDLSARSIPFDLTRIAREIGFAHAAELAELQSNSNFNIETHCLVIIEDHCKREVLKIGQQIANDSHIDAFDLMDNVNRAMMEIEQSITRSKIETMAQVITEINRKNNSKQYIKTHFNRLDKIIGGWTKSDLVIVAGRPGMGKTAFALSAAYNLAKTGTNVGFFSLEMASTQLVNRMRSYESRVPSFVISKGKANEQQKNALYDADNALRDLPIFIQSTASLNISEFRSQAIKMARKNRIDILFVDYLQLISGSTHHKGNKVQEVSEISRVMKQVAMELDIPVIALSQLNRAVETRGGDKRPQLSDLRDSGSIEQDADIVTFLYRPEYYKMDVMQDFESWDLLNVPAENTATLIIQKHRAGALSDIPLTFDKNTTRMTDYMYEEFKIPTPIDNRVTVRGDLEALPF